MTKTKEEVAVERVERDRQVLIHKIRQLSETEFRKARSRAVRSASDEVREQNKGYETAVREVDDRHRERNKEIRKQYGEQIRVLERGMKAELEKADTLHRAARAREERAFSKFCNDRALLLDALSEGMNRVERHFSEGLNNLSIAELQELQSKGLIAKPDGTLDLPTEKSIAMLCEFLKAEASTS